MNEIKKQGQEDTVGGGGDRDGAAPVQQREQKDRQALPSRRSPREYCFKDYSSTARGLCIQSQHLEGRA